MDNQLNSLAVVVSYFPVYGSRGISPKKGIVNITKTGLDLASRWYTLGEKNYSLPYEEIDSYGVTPMGLYINHHSKSCLRFVSIRKLPFRSRGKGDEELGTLTQALENNGIHPAPVRASKSTLILSAIFLLVFLVLALLLVRAGLFSKK